MGFHLQNILLRLISQGVNLVVHQLGEKPPIIILRYTLHQVIGVFTHSHHTTTSTWAMGVGAKIEVIHITLNLQRVLLYVLTIAQSHSWHHISESPNIELHLQFVVLLQLIPQRLCIFRNAILLLQWPLHREENSWQCDSMVLHPCFKLCPVLPNQCFLCTVVNAENLLVLQEYFDIQTPVLVVCNIKLFDCDCCRFGNLRYSSSQSILLCDCVADAHKI